MSRLIQERFDIWRSGPLLREFVELPVLRVRPSPEQQPLAHVAGVDQLVERPHQLGTLGSVGSFEDSDKLNVEILSYMLNARVRIR
jgi:hypothetical protein